MTARSFTEALRIGDPYADSEPIHATWCVAASFVVGEECDCPAATIKALIADRERAIRWAVTLEGQTASVDRVLGEIEDGEHATTGRQFGQGMAHAAKLIRAALTGSTE